MIFSKIEFYKIYCFITENSSQTIKGFSKSVLSKIYNNLNSSHFFPNYKLTNKQVESLKDFFIKNKCSFSEETPKIFLEDKDCIKAAVISDVESLDFINDVPEEIKDSLITLAIQNNYILNTNSPNFLLENFDVAKNSINLNSSSANYVNWDAFNDAEAEILINQLLKSYFIFSNATPYFLRRNKSLALSSLKKYINSYIYIDEYLLKDPDIFKYLILNGAILSEELVDAPIENLLDFDVMERCFNILGINNDKEEAYKKRYVKFYHDVLCATPTIKSFKQIFEASAEKEWKEHKQAYPDLYENIFGKICAELRSETTFISSIKYIQKMEEILGDKYLLLEKSMNEYHDIYHSNKKRKLEKLKKPQDEIAKLSALYIAKSKEKFKREKINDYQTWLSKFFTLKLDHPLVQKRLLFEKQVEEFSKRYFNSDKEIDAFIDDLANKYSDSTINMHVAITEFMSGAPDIENIIIKPLKYEDYLRYKKAQKLINRLNSGYISYNGIELENYKDIVAYDQKSKKYIYTGPTFSDKEIREFLWYEKEELAFKKIRRDIFKKVKEIKINEEINPNYAKALAYEFPITDEYFIFNQEYLRKISIASIKYHLFSDFSNSFMSDRVFKNLDKVLVSNNLIWMMLMLGEIHSLLAKYINGETINTLIKHMSKMIKIAKEFNFDLTNFADLMIVKEMCNANDKSIAILGKDIIYMLCHFREYTDSKSSKIISMATDLICQMAKRSTSTVPYISGNILDYHYNMYDTQDTDILLAGINTDACFRIDGNDNDFLHYCALDKNGFVIKITDSFGNFIGRASGFRNGNCVFINQLRTIYDEGGIGFEGKYKNEQNDIIEVFKRACQDIVEISQANIEEESKIDYVFVTASYSFKDFESNIKEEVCSFIGETPMDTESDDWDKFLKTAKNLNESIEDDMFETDYGCYPLICIASIKPTEDINTKDIKLDDVEALYSRKRSQITITKEPNKEDIEKINKIIGIKSYFDNTEYKSTNIPKDSIVCIGDNWYIIYNSGTIISSHVFDFDEKAVKEFNIIKDELENRIARSDQQASKRVRKPIVQ